MRVSVDTGACTGHGRCYSLAPAVFSADDEGYAVLLVDGELSGEMGEAARLAALNCPERAITIS